MNQIEIGKFIAVCRREKKLTQAQLAERLNITDRAVSKWETGKSLPDSSIMLELCEILGITVNELLSGEKVAAESCERKADENLIALKRKEENSTIKNRLIFIIFSGVLLTGILVCMICDAAISGGMTWSLIPACSILFAWLISGPAIFYGKRGIIKSLISLSICLLPYLYLLSRLVETREVFSVGAGMSAVSIPFLWVIYAVFSRLGRKRIPAALGISFLAGIPFQFAVNMILSKMIGEPIFDVWDLLSAGLLLLLALVSFGCGHAAALRGPVGHGESERKEGGA